MGELLTTLVTLRKPTTPEKLFAIRVVFFQKVFFTYSDIDCADNKSCVPSTLRQIVLQLEAICA